MELPEFRDSLTRLAPGETAYPEGPDVPHYEYQGQRSKFGGKPDSIQGERPSCEFPHCEVQMTFIAQIDSVEHSWPSNPHAKPNGEDRKWMIADVGMIFVFYCFDCGYTDSFVEST